jgi:hypothetical protein
MKTLFVVLLALVAVSSAQATPPDSVKSHQAVLKLCNPLVRSYCEQSVYYGKGFGVISFVGNPMLPGWYPVWYGGVDRDRASMMGGRLQAFETLQMRDNRDKSVFKTDPFMVSGYFLLERVNDKPIFVITNMNSAFGE